MRLESSSGVATIDRMPPKKSSGGKHQKKRIGVNIPAEWHAVMRQLAAKQKQPVLWYLIDLVMKDAESQDVETPEPPWVSEDPPAE
jgi:hypothetical protein